MRVDLQSECGAAPTCRIALEEVGPQRGQDDTEEGAQDPILIGVRDRLEPLLQPLDEPCGGTRRRALCRSARHRRQTQREEPPKIRGEGGMGGEGARHVDEAEGDAGLQQPTTAGTQHARLVAIEGGQQDQAVERVIIEIAGAHRAHRGEEPLACAQWVGGGGRFTQLQFEVLKRDIVDAG